MTITLAPGTVDTAGPGSLFAGSSDHQVAGAHYRVDLQIYDPGTGRTGAVGSCLTNGTTTFLCVAYANTLKQIAEPADATFQDGHSVTCDLQVINLSGGATIDSISLSGKVWSGAGDLGNLISLLRADLSAQLAAILAAIGGGGHDPMLDQILAAVTFTAH